MSKTFSVERVIEIVAPMETVLSFFTDNERFAAWFGAGSRIEARVGGKVEVVLPGGVKAGGVVEVFEPPRRIRFTWGYSGSATIPIGASHLDITLEETPAGTRVRLQHSGIPTEADVPEQTQGWRYHMAVFGRAVTAIDMRGQRHFPTSGSPRGTRPTPPSARDCLPPAPCPVLFSAISTPPQTGLRTLSRTSRRFTYTCPA